MNPVDLKYLLEIAGAFGIGGVVAALLLFFFVKSFIPSYLNQKALNLATKEDIADITQKIESVKSQYAVLLEQVKVRNQLKMAALDKRLQAHQEAFSLWGKMNKTPYGEEFKQLHAECSNWWDNNCLYLDSKVRSEFLNSINALNFHHQLVRSHMDHMWEFADSEKLFIAIFEATKLPPLTSSELKIIDQAAIGIKGN